MRTSHVSAIFLVLVAFAAGHSSAHVDSQYLTDECGSCHVGHGMSGEPMLAQSGERHCYQCHSSDSERHRMVEEGRLLEGARLQDIEREFDKAYHHPVGERAGHDPAEQLPRMGFGSTNHAECVDCHSPHQRLDSVETGMRQVPAYTLDGQVVERAAREYEVCLKCHSDEANLQTDGVPLEEAFHVAARSQHPVTRPSSGLAMPSVIGRFAPSSSMTCSDCHTNDDPDGPRGPHGSSHRFLLSGNYDTDSQAMESPFAYEFCYSCHDRTSILDGDSFPLHELHIVGDMATGKLGTSCYTCHVSHGSMDAPHLLRFSASRILPEGGTGRLEFNDLGDRAGECWMSCHGYNHAGARY